MHQRSNNLSRQTEGRCSEERVVIRELEVGAEFISSRAF